MGLDLGAGGEEVEEVRERLADHRHHVLAPVAVRVGGSGVGICLSVCLSV